MVGICPHCRAPINVEQVEDVIMATPTESQVPLPTGRTHRISTEIAVSEGYEIADSVTLSIFPWRWPTDAEAVREMAPTFHASTALRSGKLSFIVDPGAWTSLVGKTLAREMTKRAVAAGHKPQQSRLAKPLTVAGVGSVEQYCNFKMTLPVAVPNMVGDDQKAMIHELTTPIVEGIGEHLPGFLGLRTLDSLRAVLDIENRRLIFPGPGTVQIIPPPGSVTVPLEKVPSGHSVMLVDDYDAVPKQHGA